MAGLSNYWRNHLLSHGMGKETYTAPAHYYVALSLTNPLGDGSGISEPVGGGYARSETLPSDWSDISSFEVHNVNTIQFAKATSGWGTVVYFAVFDASTGGNMLFYGTINSGVGLTINTNDVPDFLANQLSFTH